MSRSIVWQLIGKDLYLHRWFIAISLVAGLAALPFAGDDGVIGNIGLILLLTAIVALGVFIAMYGVLSERQTKSLLFVLSLPISPMQYAVAKVAASMIAFLIPWGVLTVTILGHNILYDPPADGQLPFQAAMMLFFLANFCALLALLFVTRSEVWAIAGILVTNFGVAAYMNAVPRMPGVAGTGELPDPVWSPQILATIGIEAAVAAFCLALIFYVQSKRKDHV